MGQLQLRVSFVYHMSSKFAHCPSAFRALLVTVKKSVVCSLLVCMT